MGFTDCTHVALDCYYIPCDQDEETNPCKFVIEGIPDIAWLETKEEGKCHFCILEEEDAKKEKNKKRKRTSGLRESDLYEGFNFLKKEP
jgi:hypothetical protein